MGFVIHRQARGGQREQHQREFALHEFTGILVGVAAEGLHSFFQHLEPDGLVAVDHLSCLGGVIPERIPEGRIPDVVQAERDQRALYQTEDKGRCRLIIAVNHHGERVDTGLDMLPHVRQQQPHQERQKRRCNGHEALAGEKAQELRQLHGVEAVIAPGRENTADQAAEDAHLQRRDADDHGVFPALGGHFRRDAQHGADGDIRDKHRHRRRQRRDAGF